MRRGGIFDTILSRRPKLNKFDLSHEVKMSGEMGYLLPCYVQDIMPGDRFRVRTEAFLRMQPLTTPMMHRVNAYIHYFFVPNRLVWTEWEDFITGGKLGTSNPVHPFFKASTLFAVDNTLLRESTMWDYMGLPLADADPSGPADISINALPFRAVQLIWNEYFRDQNLTDEAVISFASGEVTDSGQLQLLTQLRKRAWEKDYYTSCLPFAQRGTAVGIPFGDAEITYSDEALMRRSDTGVLAPSTELGLIGGASSVPGRISYSGHGGATSIENIDEIQVSGTINDLRRSMALQRWLEAMARGGARYAEMLLNVFGVKYSDARLQRPEYLGGGKQPFQISEVLSNSTNENFDGTSVYSFTGDMYGHGMSVGSQNQFSRRFEEHGYVIGFLSVLPRTAYMQNISKHMLQKVDKFDYPFPQFAHIGEQEVLNKEVFWNGTVAGEGPNGVFGYQSRYAEHKYCPDRVAGDFKNTLYQWHMARYFGSQPALDAAFVQSDPTTRIFNVPDATNHLLCQLYHNVSALRPLPYYSTPI